MHRSVLVQSINDLKKAVFQTDSIMVIQQPLMTASAERPPSGTGPCLISAFDLFLRQNQLQVDPCASGCVWDA